MVVFATAVRETAAANMIGETIGGIIVAHWGSVGAHKVIDFYTGWKKALERCVNVGVFYERARPRSGRTTPSG